MEGMLIELIDKLRYAIPTHSGYVPTHFFVTAKIYLQLGTLQSHSHRRRKFATAIIQHAEGHDTHRVSRETA